MKKSILIIVFAVLCLTVYCKQIPPDKAKAVAESFLETKSGKVSIELTYIGDSFLSYNSDILSKGTDKNEYNDIYVFRINENGFIIISGDDSAIPVLGYSYLSGFDPADIPTNMMKWIETYRKQIKHIKKNNLPPSKEIKQMWDGKFDAYAKVTKGVGPLLTSTWGQSPYYNDQCPGGSVAGCVATAMAQIMNYWEHPARGSGFHSYNENDYGTLSASFGTTNYDWASMPDNVSSSNDAVATLIYHCGVSVETDYNPGGSSAYTHKVVYALKSFFSYSSTAGYLSRSDYASDGDWIQVLKNELDAGRPMQYRGSGYDGGHAFVVDGYDDSDYLHINWGWRGSNDGYFLFGSLNPGTYEFNNYNGVITGIEPQSETVTYDLDLNDDVVPSPNPVAYNHSFTVHTDIVNNGDYDFEGDYCVAIFDSENNFVDYADILEGVTLSKGSNYSEGISFSVPGLFSVVPGTYSIGIFYRVAEGNWVPVSDGTYSNMVPFEVYNENDIELHQDMVIDVGARISQNQAFTVTLGVENTGITNFTGLFNVSLYDLDGSQAAIVETRNNLNIDPSAYLDDLVFSSAGVSIDPGTYLMALQHSTDDSDWNITGSANHANPVKVTIYEEVPGADIYESNDTEGEAYSLMLSFTADNATVETTSSNIHNSTDLDYYKIDLDPGYEYKIKVRAHDSYNSGNGLTYTNDVAWSFYDGSQWSEIYDDIRGDDIMVYDGGSLIFRVTPYFEGKIGTYLLDINIERPVMTGITGNDADRILNVYPNPFFNKINVVSGETILDYNIFDIHGRLLMKDEFNSHSGYIDLSGLDKGMYLIILRSENKVYQRKLMKQ